MTFTDIVGGKIKKINRVCDLITMEFKTSNQQNIYVHVQSFFRFIKDNRVIISSEDMYRCGKNIDSTQFVWDVPGQSIFDQSLKENFDFIRTLTVIDVIKHPTGDITFCFEKNALIQILINTAEFEENYRIFDDSETIIVSS